MIHRRQRQQTGLHRALEVEVAASACAAHSHPRLALFVIAAAALLLLSIGIHNAWDAVTYHVFVRRREQRGRREQRRAEQAGNAINPGVVRTARLQTLSKENGISAAEAEALMVADAGIAKIGEPEDVANLAAFIVSPQNRYLHGALIDLDCGTTKTM